MCVTGVMLAATALQAYGQVQQGRDERAMANYQAEQARADADAQAAAARLTAEKIRKAGDRARSEALAAVAGSGASTDSIGAGQIDDSIVSAYEEDALVSIYGGQNTAERMRAEAQGYRQAGSRVNRNALLSSSATAMSGWYTTQRRNAPGAPIDSSRNTRYRG